jgi:hypothetical protein
LEIAERRPGLLDFGGGERPAGLRIGADFGVEIVWEVLKGVERRGETVERATREVLGLETLGSSSSQVRLRFVESLEGSIFSESTKMVLGFIDLGPMVHG